MTNSVPYDLEDALWAVLLGVGYFKSCGCDGKKSSNQSKCKGGCQCSICNGSVSDGHTCAENCSCSLLTAIGAILCLTAFIIFLIYQFDNPIELVFNVKPAFKSPSLSP